MHAILRLLLIGLAVLIPAAAEAEGPIAMPIESAPTEPLYFSPDLGYQVQNMPKFQTGSRGPGSALPFFANSPTADGVGGGVTIGLFPPGNWPQFGRFARLEFGLAYFDQTDTASAHYPGGTSPLTQWVFIGGRSSTASTGGVFGSSLRSEYRGYEMSARAATDLPVTDSLTLTPAMGLFGGNSDSIFNYTDTEFCTLACFNQYVRENVSANRAGGSLSLGARFAIADRLSLVGGVNAAVFELWSQLSGTDCFAGIPNVACESSLPITSTVTNRKNTLAARLGGQAGLRYDAGWTTIALTGGLNWESAMPGVSNPVLAGHGATVAYASEIGYSVRLALSIPFGGATP